LSENRIKGVHLPMKIGRGIPGAVAASGLPWTVLSVPDIA